MSRSGPQAPSRWGPRWSRWVGRVLARGLWRTEVRGIQHVPGTGPVIVVANHLGLIDGPLVHGLLRRGSHFLITRDMFRGVLGALLLGAAQIPVDGGGREALARGRQVLLREGIVGVFPEGTRGQGMADQVQGGAAWLGLHTEALIVPVAIFGTRRTGEGVNVWPSPRRRILVEFGVPHSLTPPPDLKGRARQQWAEATVATVLRDHVSAVAATTDIELPTDIPVRRKEQA